ncbi:MAG: hypothetical protein AAB600_02180 [Patescibacteria group bacterium]
MQNHKSQKGQALITLIFFVLIAITITSGAIIMIAVNSTSIGKLQEGSISYDVAEAGIENGLLRLLRNPNYTGETLPIDTATVVITVSGSNPKTIVAVGTNGNFKRTVQAQMTYSGGYYTLSGWREI